MAFIGFIVWVVASVIEGVGTGLGAKSDPVLWFLIYAGFVVMVGGPLYYWLFNPVRGWLGHRRLK